MHRNTVRLALAAVAVFYVVVGGLWAVDYFPISGFYKQVELTHEFQTKSQGIEYLEDANYKKANEKVEQYALTHGDLTATEERVGLYQAILLWGTIALAVAASVLFLTRKRRAN